MRVAFLLLSCTLFTSACRDIREDCSKWAENGDCEMNEKYMSVHCPQSCGTCAQLERRATVSRSRRSYAPDDLGMIVGRDLGEPQVIRRPEQTDDILQVIDEAREYYQTTVQQDPRYALVVDTCRNYHPRCAEWTVAGRCEDDPDFMFDECPLVCEMCEDLHLLVKCPWDPLLTKNAWYPGDLSRTFSRLVDAYPNATVLSQPPSGPWVVVLDDFLSEAEAQALIDQGHAVGYERSTSAAQGNDAGLYENKVTASRTSTNAWCGAECKADPDVSQALARLHSLLDIPMGNSEDLQLLRYEPGQFYKVHHDFIDAEQDKIQGGRLLTVFLYLNEVASGGATRFPSLNVTVTPKRGRALIWPSVTDANPNIKDMRTRHEAMVVDDGIKYAANAWIHQRDYQRADEMGCL